MTSPKNVCQTGGFAGQSANTNHEKEALILVSRFSSALKVRTRISRLALFNAKLLNLLEN